MGQFRPLESRGKMSEQNKILDRIEEINHEIEKLTRERMTLKNQLPKVYYVQNISIEDAALILCHGSEAHCRQYMLDHYSQGHWYSGTSQFSPIENPRRINWAVLNHVNAANTKEWKAVHDYIENPNEETMYSLIAIWRG